MKSENKRRAELAGIYYYISSILNVLKFEKKLPEKPESWYGPFSRKNEAEVMKRNMLVQKENKKRRMNIP